MSPSWPGGVSSATRRMLSSCAWARRKTSSVGSPSTTSRKCPPRVDRLRHCLRVRRAVARPTSPPNTGMSGSVARMSEPGQQVLAELDDDDDDGHDRRGDEGWEVAREVAVQRVGPSRGQRREGARALPREPSRSEPDDVCHERGAQRRLDAGRRTGRGDLAAPGECGAAEDHAGEDQQIGPQRGAGGSRPSRRDDDVREDKGLHDHEAGRQHGGRGGDDEVRPGPAAPGGTTGGLRASTRPAWQRPGHAGGRDTGIAAEPGGGSPARPRPRSPQCGPARGTRSRSSPGRPSTDGRKIDCHDRHHLERVRARRRVCTVRSYALFVLDTISRGYRSAKIGQDGRADRDRRRDEGPSARAGRRTQPGGCDGGQYGGRLDRLSRTPLSAMHVRPDDEAQDHQRRRPVPAPRPAGRRAPRGRRWS